MTVVIVARSTTTADTKATTDMGTIVPTGTTTASIRAGTIRITRTTAIGTTTMTASALGMPIPMADTSMCGETLSRGTWISGRGAWCSTTTRIGWLLPMTWIAAAIGNGNATASTFTTTIITPVGT